MSAPVFGAVEAGGAKFVCGAGSGPADLVRATIPTTTPAETLGRVVQFFREQMRRMPVRISADDRSVAVAVQRRDDSAQAPIQSLARQRAVALTDGLRAIGVASFGPVDLDPASPTYGYITSTPKPGWSSFDICGALRDALGLPVAFDTDVNAAALAESKWGAGKDLDNILYLTVGSGIGGGAVIDGRLLRGLSHSEMGHIRIPHDRAADPFPGVCPYHGDCLEGLASGPAIERRWNMPAEDLPSGHPAWALEARYLALGLASLVCALSPRRVIMGGGVMRRLDLFPMIRAGLSECLNGYVQAPEVVPPALGEDAGVLGAMILAQRLLNPSL